MTSIFRRGDAVTLGRLSVIPMWHQEAAGGQPPVQTCVVLQTNTTAPYGPLVEEWNCTPCKMNPCDLEVGEMSCQK